LRQKKKRLYLNIDQLVELLLSRFCKRCINTNPGIVDEEIKLLGLPFVLKCLLDLRYKIVKGFGVEVSSCATALPPISSIAETTFCFYLAAAMRHDDINRFWQAPAVFLPNPRLAPVIKEIFVVSCAIALFFHYFLGMCSS